MSVGFLRKLLLTFLFRWSSFSRLLVQIVEMVVVDALDGVLEGLPLLFGLAVFFLCPIKKGFGNLIAAGVVASKLVGFLDFEAGGRSLVWMWCCVLLPH